MRLGDVDHPTTREEARANPRPGPYSYGWPSTLAFLPNGDFLLADGYWNSRVIRYDADGGYIMNGESSEPRPASSTYSTGRP